MRMPARLRTPYRLSVLLLALMAAQAALGLAVPGRYRDRGMVLETWFGNDLVTLVLGVPLLALALWLARRGAVRGQLLWLGLLAYAVYNGAFYLLGAALNAFFPLYVATVLTAAGALLLALIHTDVHAVAARFRARTPVRWIGGYLSGIAVGLTGVWLGLWAAHLMGGQPVPGGPEAFKIVAALDLTLMVPALATGGVLLWRRRPWGYVLAPLAAIQGGLYLIILALNSARFVARGLVPPPGEVPLWGALALATGLAAGSLLACVRERRAS